MSSPEQIFKVPDIPPKKPLKKRSSTESNIIFNDKDASPRSKSGILCFNDGDATRKATTESSRIELDDRAFVTGGGPIDKHAIKSSKSETNVQYVGNKNAGRSVEETTVRDFKPKDSELSITFEKPELNFQQNGLQNQTLEYNLEGASSSKRFATERKIPVDKSIATGERSKLETTMIHSENRDPRIKTIPVESAFEHENSRDPRLRSKGKRKLEIISTMEEIALYSEDTSEDEKMKFTDESVMLFSADGNPRKRAKYGNTKLNSQRIEQKNKSITKTKIIDTSDTEEFSCSAFLCSLAPFTSFWRRWLDIIKKDRQFRSRYNKIPLDDYATMPELLNFNFNDQLKL